MLTKYIIVDKISGEYVTREGYSKDLNEALLYSTEEHARGTRQICHAEEYQRIMKITLEVKDINELP